MLCGPELSGSADRRSADAGDPTEGSRTYRVHPAGSGWFVAPGRAVNSAGRGPRCARDRAGGVLRPRTEPAVVRGPLPVADHLPGTRS